MRLKIVSILFISLLALSCSREIENDLNKLKSVKIEKFVGNRFTLNIKQPLDHKNSDSETFNQRFYLKHVGYDRPVVVVTDGYSSYLPFNDEVAEILDANLIVINYRYYNESMPENPDYKYLTIEQAANDHHKIVELFKKHIYKNSKWISTGISKGGMSAVYFKRFYPDDVDVVVSRVAPMMFGTDDKRIQEFINDDKRVDKAKEIKEFQQEALERRDELIPLISKRIRKNTAMGKKLTSEEILELLVYEFSFIFWQNGSAEYKYIPEKGSPAAYMVMNLVDENSWWFPMTEIPDLESYLYQTQSEIGACSPLINSDVGFKYDIENIYRKLCSNYDDINFKSEVMLDINNWLQNEGNNIIHIYGEEDPWSAFQVEIGSKTNAVKLYASDQAHLFQLQDLNDYDLFINTLNKWLEIM